MTRPTRIRRSVRAAVFCGALLLSWKLVREADSLPRSSEQDLAREILQATGVRGGLIVHLDCGDARLTAALHESDRCLVHGLDTDREDVRKGRDTVRKLGVYGPVSIDRFDGKRLPYADNLVRLIVAEDPGDVPRTEALRVLAPGGALYAKRDGRWEKTIKSRLPEEDDWTHFLHDASGNAVSRDRAVGPPRRVQWIAEPRHARSHEHTPSIHAVVSAGGRIFYLADETSVDSLVRAPDWNLVARDAYSGLLLWKRSFTAWFPHLVNWGQTPPQLQRRLVVNGDRVYVTLGLHAPLSVLDAETGEILKTHEGTEGTEEVIFHRDVLLLSIRKVTEARAAELASWRRMSQEDGSPLYDRDSAAPLVERLRKTESEGTRTLLALDSRTGRRLWTRSDADVAGLANLTLCAVGERALYQKGGNVVCLDLTTGRESWSKPASRLRTASGAAVYCADGKNVTALSMETGRTLWTQPTLLSEIRDAFVIRGSLWLGGFKPLRGEDVGKRGPVWGPYFATERDLRTGEVLKHIEPENPGHHHRCWSNKATERYILGGRRGVEFIDLETGDVLWNSWVRGVCRYGVMPANGLLYAPPHACGCYVAAKLTGFYALAPEGTPGASIRADDEERLEPGPAYSGDSGVGRPEVSEHDWSTYRHDASRSGSTRTTVSTALRVRWQADLGGRLTSPTVSEGMVFVASVDEHRVTALDAESGRARWDFTAGSRVDSPPTVHAGRALFGCRDGYVYSVRTADGALAWRFLAAGRDRRVAAWGQLESASPVHGSVLVQDGVVCFTAGRSSYLDGGLDLWRLQPETGEILTRTPIYSPDPETGKQPPHDGPGTMPGALGEILSSDDRHVYLRDMVFDKSGKPAADGSPHLFTLTGFLDDSRAHRSYWIYGTQCSLATGCTRRERDLVYGRLIAFDDATIYGYGRQNVHWSNAFQDGAYRLFAVERGSGSGAARWTKRLTTQIGAMVLAGDVLFVAGSLVRSRTNPQGRDAGESAVLVALSTADGTELATYGLDAPPVLDGMAAANGRLYVALEGGRILCLEAKAPSGG